MTQDAPRPGPDPAVQAGAGAGSETLAGLPADQSRRTLSPWDLARWAFLVAVLGFGWWGLRSRGPELAAALRQTSPVRCLLAALLVLVGLALTGLIWRRLLASYGHAVPVRPAAATFFVGQLGKYIPGSVWTLGAQADMARRFGVPVRTTVAVGLLFLWVHVVTAVPVAAVSADLSALGWLDTSWLRIAAGLLALVALTPPVLTHLGRVLARPATPRLTWGDTAVMIGLMAVVWLLYGLAAVLVVPPDSLAAAGGVGAVLGSMVGAFALSYVIGVVVILAPAGVGAREASLIALLTPTLGVTTAAATALLTRGVHTVCDFTIAGLAWWAGRGGSAAGPQELGPGR